MIIEEEPYEEISDDVFCSASNAIRLCEEAESCLVYTSSRAKERLAFLADVLLKLTQPNSLKADHAVDTVVPYENGIYVTRSLLLDVKFGGWDSNSRLCFWEKLLYLTQNCGDSVYLCRLRCLGVLGHAGELISPLLSERNGYSVFSLLSGPIQALRLLNENKEIFKSCALDLLEQRTLALKKTVLEMQTHLGLDAWDCALDVCPENITFPGVESLIERLTLLFVQACIGKKLSFVSSNPSYLTPFNIRMMPPYMNTKCLDSKYLFLWNCDSTPDNQIDTSFVELVMSLQPLTMLKIHKIASTNNLVGDDCADAVKIEQSEHQSFVYLENNCRVKESIKPIKNDQEKKSIPTDEEIRKNPEIKGDFFLERLLTSRARALRQKNALSTISQIFNNDAEHNLEFSIKDFAKLSAIRYESIDQVIELVANLIRHSMAPFPLFIDPTSNVLKRLLI